MLSLPVTALLVIFSNFAISAPTPENGGFSYPEDIFENFPDADEDTHTSNNVPYRLPQHIEPTYYNLRIAADLEGLFNFSGEVTIYFQTKENSTNITINSHKLNIKKVEVKNGIHAENSTYELDTKGQRLVIKTQNPIRPGMKYKVTIHYDGILSDDPMGFYRSYYKIEDEKR